ncbi:hypothetical protein SKAU_G00359910 [Synaphobranchus kaupii]|uniref:Uncharacterized protein n=1 Tax=Synaphobranchus kaupii TaxID=118154 RepID=A0A9Q1EI55_SYNKA|nr:hypothetical protein SKAU_G00359910 [Synaphobranchus kaupii]
MVWCRDQVTDYGDGVLGRAPQSPAPPCEHVTSLAQRPLATFLSDPQLPAPSLLPFRISSEEFSAAPHPLHLDGLARNLFGDRGPVHGLH